jgi:glycine/D-amino acid oxidase-like deaminating enzyme
MSESQNAMSRRKALQVGAASAAMGLLPKSLRGAPVQPAGAALTSTTVTPLRVLVVGAGAFGGWTALALQRRGAQVTLVDAWGAGHSRSSSGDETRIIRSVYNGDPLYTDMVVRAASRWRAAEERWGRRVFHRTGALYMFEGDDAFATRSLPLARERGITVEPLALDEARRRFPQIRFAEVRTVYWEPEAGYLLARGSCELVREEFVRAGGTWRVVSVKPGAVQGGRMGSVQLSDGDRLEADVFVFACGPWLGKLFPDVVSDGIVPTRQDVVYFGTAPGDQRYDESRFPVWINFGERLLYGIPGNERRGFKVADDSAGEAVDPTTLDRVVTAKAMRIARAVLARRFPGLVGAAVAETRVCQYEFSPTGDFLLDRHPGASNAWLVGGGSGHGFKMGPAVGDDVAGLILDRMPTAPQFSYAHFEAARTARRKAAGKRTHS